MTREQMLHAEVSRRLQASGAPHDYDAVTAAIRGIREDVAGFLVAFALEMVKCPNTDCGCLAAATIYNAIATEVREAA
ncbi:hypothetical protein [Pseudonocardia sp. NPDC049154]|uniref:hypothetical protein n=1 Tax=Pseudonocardia sp. NPDC049154 TaxID=3155501 RepID=UPI0033DFF655